MQNSNNDNLEMRRKKIVKLIKEHLPDANIIELSKEYIQEHKISGDLTWRVKIEINTSRTSHIIFQPDATLMSCQKNKFEEVLKAGVDELKQYHNDTLKIVKVYLSSTGVQTEDVM